MIDVDTGSFFAIVLVAAIASITVAVVPRGLAPPVVVLERASTLGGRARTDVHAGYAHNLGGHALYVGGHADPGATVWQPVDSTNFAGRCENISTGIACLYFAASAGW